MTHAALMNAALLLFLVFVTLLLVMFIGAVIVAPSAPPDSSTPAPETPAPPAPEPAALPVPEMPGSPAPLPRRRPLATVSAAGVASWSADADADGRAGAPMPVYSAVLRPEVSGGPPWGPAPKPPGADPWASESPPGWQRRPEERPVSPSAVRPANGPGGPRERRHAGQHGAAGESACRPPRGLHPINHTQPVCITDRIGRVAKRAPARGLVRPAPRAGACQCLDH
jgi:hypothetical protein